MLRLIMHDWADPYAEIILRHLRNAASPDTKLVVIDSIVPYTCHSAAALEVIEGARMPDIPKELLPSLGKANNHVFQLDMMVSGNYGSHDSWSSVGF